MKNNWFETLSEALQSEGLEDTYPTFHAIGYGETFKYDTEDGLHVSIYRETDGRYERPISYSLK